MRTIEKEAEIIYGKRKPNAEKTRMALVEEKKRMKRQIGCHSFGLITLCKTCNFTLNDERCQYVMKYFSKEPELEKTLKEKVIVKPGDACLDAGCKGKFVISLVCDDDTCGNTVHPEDGYQIQIPSLAPKDEGELCDIILRHADLLTCYNCGDKLSDKVQVGNDDKVGVLRIDPGSNNYPREPDEPAQAYFECMECAKINLLKSKGLNQIQVDLLSSFLVRHWKEISKSEHRVAFERILETLNPGSLQAVKNLAKGG